MAFISNSSSNHIDALSLARFDYELVAVLFNSRSGFIQSAGDDHFGTIVFFLDIRINYLISIVLFLFIKTYCDLWILWQLLLADRKIRC